MSDFELARRNMIESQIRTNKVWDDRLIDALSTTPRETFVPKALRAIAYVDEDLSLGDGRYVMEPMVLARLVQAAEVDTQDVALVLGGASGYSAAILARLCATVVGIEEDETLLRRAVETLSTNGIDNAVMVPGNPANGNPGQAPYDVILYDGACSEVPNHVLEQLADGGRLVAVIRGSEGVGVATLFRRNGGAFSRRELFDANIPFLPGHEPKPAFAL